LSHFACRYALVNKEQQESQALNGQGDQGPKDTPSPGFEGVVTAQAKPVC